MSCLSALDLDQKPLQTWRCTLQRLVENHQQWFMVCYDNERFFEEICMEFVDPIHNG